MKYLDYKGYTGSIEYSSDDELLYGKVLGIRGLLSYEGSTGPELESDFRGVIDEYLADCKEGGIKPEKPYKGSFNVRISSTLHREAALTALELDTSLNNFVKESIRIRIANTKRSRPMYTTKDIAKKLRATKSRAVIAKESQKK